LSSYQTNGRMVEDLPRNRSVVFPLAAAHDVGLLIMKPLAGGLLCPSKSFPPRARFSDAFGRVTAAEVLRDILALPGIACVVPGMASVEAAERLDKVVVDLKTTMCSRCGVCDSLCSHRLHVSWLFRDAYVNHFPAET